MCSLPGFYAPKADLTAPKSDFRFTPESGLMSDISPCPFRASNGHWHGYSITRRPGGMPFLQNRWASAGLCPTNVLSKSFEPQLDGQWPQNGAASNVHFSRRHSGAAMEPHYQASVLRKRREVVTRRRSGVPCQNSISGLPPLFWRPHCQSPDMPLRRAAAVMAVDTEGVTAVGIFTAGATMAVDISAAPIPGVDAISAAIVPSPRTAR